MVEISHFLYSIADLPLHLFPSILCVANQLDLSYLFVSRIANLLLLRLSIEWLPATPDTLD